MQDETLNYALQKLEKQNEDILDEVRELRKELVSKELYESESSDLERRIVILENNANRVTWAILGAAGSILLSLGKTILGI